MTCLRDYVGQHFWVGSSRNWHYLTSKRAWYLSPVQVSGDKCIISFITDPSEAFQTRFRHVVHEWHYELLISSSLSTASSALKIKNIIEICESVPLEWANCLRWKYQRVFPCVLRKFGSNLCWIFGYG